MCKQVLDLTVVWKGWVAGGSAPPSLVFWIQGEMSSSQQNNKKPSCLYSALKCHKDLGHGVGLPVFEIFVL